MQGAASLLIFRFAFWRRRPFSGATSCPSAPAASPWAYRGVPGCRMSPFSGGAGAPASPVFRLCRRLAVGLALAGTDQALLLIADEIGAARLLQRLHHQRPLLRPRPLQKCPLHGLVLGVAGHVDLRHVPRVDTRVVHAGGQRAGRGIKVLHLLRRSAVLCRSSASSTASLRVQPGWLDIRYGTRYCSVPRSSLSF